MKITKPICFLDIESTGLNPREDRIVEISITKAYPDGKKEVKTRRVNPTIPIAPEATKVNGISDEDVANEPVFKKLAKGLHQFISDSDIVGYGCLYFDIPLLFHEFARAGVNWDYSTSSLIDSCNIFKIHEQRTLEAAYKFYLNKEGGDFHNPEFDVSVTVDVFKEQLKRYGLKDKSMAEIALMSNYDNAILDIDGKFTRDAEGDIVFNYGKNKGKKCLEDKGYLEWMMKSDFSENTKAITQFLINNI